MSTRHLIHLLKSVSPSPTESQDRPSSMPLPLRPNIFQRPPLFNATMHYLLNQLLPSLPRSIASATGQRAMKMTILATAILHAQNLSSFQGSLRATPHGGIGLSTNNTRPCIYRDASHESPHESLRARTRRRGNTEKRIGREWLTSNIRWKRFIVLRLLPTRLAGSAASIEMRAG